LGACRLGRARSCDLTKGMPSKWKDRKGKRNERAKSAAQRVVEALWSPFERRCLMNFSYRSQQRAERRCRKDERAIECRYCGNWHVIKRGHAR